MRTIADPVVLAPLTARLERLTPERPRVWGSMTAHQMAVHLANGAEAALGRQEFEVPPRRPRPVQKLLALYLPIPWPRGVKTGSDPAGRSLSADRFEADRRRAITTLDELARAPADRLTSPHPMFGLMTPAHWHRWAYLHVDHHLRQFGL